MATVGEIQATLTADSGDFTEGVGAAADSLGSLASKVASAKGGIAGLAAAGAAAAAGGLAAAATQAAELERTIAGAAARAGATESAFNKFGAAARQASLDSAFGANEAGNALRFLAKSGFEVEQATAALPGILDGATAAGMGAADAAEIASNALRQFGKSANETQGVMDVLVKASMSANTSVQEIGKGLANVGGIANEVGMSIEQTTAVFSTLQDAGIGASRAATAMRGGISRLLNPSNKAATTLDQLGVAAKDADGNFRGLIPIISDLESAGASASDMLAIFGQEAGPTLQTALSQGGTSLRNFESQLNNAGGTTKETAGFMRDTLAEQLQVLMGSFETLGANIGEFVLPLLKGFVQLMQGLVTIANEVVGALAAVKDILEGDYASAAARASDQTKAVSEEGGKASEKMEKLAGKASGAGGALDGQADSADSAQSAHAGLVQEIRDLNSEIDKLREKARDASADTLEQAAAEDELQKKMLERQKQQGKLAEAGLGELQSEVQSLNSELAGTERRLALNRDILKDELDKAGIDADPANVGSAQVTGAPNQRKLTRLIREERKLSTQAEKTRKKYEQKSEALNDATEKAQEGLRAQNTLSEEQQKQLAILEKKEQIVNAEDEVRKEELKLEKKKLQIRKSDKALQIKRQKISNAEARTQARIRDIMKERRSEAQKPQETMRSAFVGTGQAAAGLLGSTAGKFVGSESKRDDGMVMPGPHRSTPDQKGKKTQIEGMSQEDLADMEDVSDLEAFAAAQGKTIKRAKTLTGDITGLAGALAEAAGASQQAVQGISAVGGAAQSVLGGLASGNPFGIASGILGGVTKLIGAAGGSDRGGTTEAASSRRSQRDFADLLAEKIADEQERRELFRQEINIAGRSPGRAGSSFERGRRRRARGEEIEALEGVGRED